MHFEWTFNLGNILTILAIAGVGYRVIRVLTRYQDKVDAHDKWIASHEACNKKQLEILAKVERALAYWEGRADAEKSTLPLKERY